MLRPPLGPGFDQRGVKPLIPGRLDIREPVLANQAGRRVVVSGAYLPIEVNRDVAV